VGIVTAESNSYILPVTDQIKIVTVVNVVSSFQGPCSIAIAKVIYEYKA
jgi:hypothetical protein